MTKVILIHSEWLGATDHVASLVGVEVGDLDDSLGEVLAVEAEDEWLLGGEVPHDDLALVLVSAVLLVGELLKEFFSIE